ncbi:MAG: DNA-directed RNA polymerase subunit alpha, partial [Xanthomonadales bacterium]|nr:DNA-directed RNA polymerase subunit alpha [Xanthomonadales bacterium]
MSSATGLLRPRNLQVEAISANRARVVLEPLERGFGHTLGNALRRVMLSSIPGAAIVDVEIDGVVHEYGTIEGVQEDVIEILLNLKDIAVKLHNVDQATVILSRRGQGNVVAGDITTDHNVEIVNPEHPICTLTKDVTLNMRLRIARGVGYDPSSNRRLPEDEVRPIGRLQLDASYSPIRRVSYSVDAARVEQRTDLDKLVLDVETNGTFDVEDAVKRAATVLV